MRYGKSFPDEGQQQSFKDEEQQQSFTDEVQQQSFTDEGQKLKVFLVTVVLNYYVLLADVFLDLPEYWGGSVVWGTVFYS